MEWIAEQVPNARLSVFEHSGHNPHVSEADEFNGQWLAFVAEHS
jgi:pimeloyl-ACP methyl ester carboxylesterase